MALDSAGDADDWFTAVAEDALVGKGTGTGDASEVVEDLEELPDAPEVSEEEELAAFEEAACLAWVEVALLALEALEAPPAKKPKLDAAPVDPPTRAAGVAPTDALATVELEENLGKLLLAPEVAKTLQALKRNGIKVFPTAVRALAKAPPRKAQKVLEAFLMEGQMGDPTQWLIEALKDNSKVAVAQAKAKAKELDLSNPACRPGLMKGLRVPPSKTVDQPSEPGLEQGVPQPRTPEANAPVAKPPLAKGPMSPPGVPKAPGAKAAVVKNPLAKAALAKTPLGKMPPVKAPGGKAPLPKGATVVKVGGGKAAGPKAAVGPKAANRVPPRLREGLDFSQGAVQAMLQALNSSKLWPGTHPLDESALAALLSVHSEIALEILHEVEEKGTAGTLRDPSAYVRRAVALSSREKEGRARNLG